MSTNPHDPANAARIGDLIRQLREAQGMTKASLFRASGVAESTVSRIEAGLVEPTMDTLTKLTEALDVNLLDLAELIGPDSESIASALPEPAVYFRTKYDLPKEAVEQIERQFERLAKKYGIDPNQAGPKLGEDET